MERGLRKIRVGVVSSDKMEKTITVVIENKKKHPLYGKIMITSKKIKAHDDTNDAKIGDTVEVMETRPLSKSIRWRLTKVIERAK